ncbi:MAG: prepilin-type N-terminal cleavage/methylation domain-containing protein [Planctomycetota bacterium]
MRRRGRTRTAFSLVELVVVVIILAILASVAVPRFSRGTRGAANAALVADLRQLRDAIYRYALEHQGAFPGPDAAGFVDCLTTCSSARGATQPARDPDHPFGPYLAEIPPCPVGRNAGNAAVTISHTSPPTPDPAIKAGWVYNPATGEIRANTHTVTIDGAEASGALAAAEGPG